MAKAYRTSTGSRLVNGAFSVLVRFGLGKDYRYILTAPGRTTGLPRSCPVDVMDDGQQRWLVAPYGVTNWVRNARAAGQVTLRRAGRRETLRATEVPAADRVPVLRQYWREVPVTRKFFGTTPASSDELWATEAQRHPVFRLAATPDGQS